MNTAKKRIGFAFSTMDRPEFTVRSLKSIDQNSPFEFDLLWLDGSYGPAGRALPDQTKLKHCRLIEVHRDLRGGPNAAIRFGLQRLLRLGYDYCGLLENDIEMQPGWLESMFTAWKNAEADGLRVGTVTARTFQCRALSLGPRYALMWNVGAAHALFSRLGARVVLSRYGVRNALALQDFFGSAFGCDLRPHWELFMGKPDRELGTDWGYALELYRCGLAAVGTVPSLAANFDYDAEKDSRTVYQGPTVPPEMAAFHEQMRERVRTGPIQRWNQFHLRRLEAWDRWMRLVLPT